MILKGYPRISETFISNEILLLEKLGLNIRLFSMRQPREAFCHQSVRQIRARVDYLPATLLAPLPRLLARNLRLAVRQPQRYRRAVGMAVRRWLRSRKAATFKHLLQAGYLVDRWLPGSGVAHLHAHFAHSPTSVGLFASLLSGLPFSFTAHAKDIYTSDVRQLREKIEMATFVVTCTEYNRRHLGRLLAAHPGSESRPPAEAFPLASLSNPVSMRANPTIPEADRIHRIYHGIDIRLFSGRHSPRPALAPYRILTVARLTAKKGLPTVYRALRALCDAGLEVEHTLIGDGEARDEILGLMARLDLGPAVRWLGTLPHDQVLAHYRRADLFVLGCEVIANGDRDGIPNVLVESMAMGVPVVATRVSAIPELIEDGVSGLLVAPGRPDLLAAGMRRLLTDEPLRRRVIAAARQRVVTGFDNRELVGELGTLMKRAVNSRFQ